MAKRKTLHFTGMDDAEAASLKGLFAEANRAVGEAWELTEDDGAADVVVIDVDSIYGHMAWLKMHNSNRPIVALSASSKAEADHVLVRPVDAGKLAALLSEVSGIPAKPVKRPAEPQPAKPAPAPAPQPEPAPAAAAAPAPQPPAPEPAPEPEPEPIRDPYLVDYLDPGVLPGPVKLSMEGAPDLVVDPQRGEFVGQNALKPLVPYGRRVIQPEDWEAVGPGQLEKLRAAGVQPLVRLRWLAGLARGEGKLAEGYDPQQKYKLTKWPQIEREYPKHFRIATVMMKGPQTLAEIAEASGAPLAEVTDFVNAYLAIGTAEMDAPPPPEAEAPARGGLFDRLRARR